jgi:hypothetical protein
MLAVNVAYWVMARMVPYFEPEMIKSGRWFVSYRRLRDRSRRQELDFDQIEILARQTGWAKVTLPKPRAA